jgi:thioredoxin reductase
MPEASQHRDVVIVGGGVAGLSAAIFTARAELDTLVINHGASIVKRNAHLENYPGFPAGVNPRLLIDMMADQVDRNGGDRRDAKVEAIEAEGDGFRIETSEGTVSAGNVIAATKSSPAYLQDLDVDLRDSGSKTYVAIDDDGRTAVDGLYAAGRLAEEYHQTIVSAGHGAKVAITLVEDVDPAFYHDWVAPEGYFTLRDREVPKGCEEIPKEERNRREHESVQVMQEYFAKPRDAPPDKHPSLEDEDGFDP